MQLAKNKYVVFNLLSCLFGTFNVTFWYGFLNKEFEEKGFDTNNIGYVIGSESFVYLCCCLALPYTCVHTPRRLQFMLSMFGLGFGMCLLGPS